MVPLQRPTVIRAIKQLFVVATLFFTPVLVVSIPAVHAQEPPDVSYSVPQLGVPIPGLDLSKYPIVRKVDRIAIPWLGAYIAAVYKYLVGVSVIAAAIMIVYGGFKYILASSLSGVQSGKEIITDAIVGLLLILGTYTVLNVLNPSTTLFQQLEIEAIKRQDYINHSAALDGVPLEQMAPQDRPDVTPPVVPGEKPLPPPEQPPPVVLEGPPPTVPETPRVSIAPGAIPGPDKPGVGKGCTDTPAYNKPGPPPCTGDACKKRFCEDKNYKDLPNIPEKTELVGFQGIFPDTIGEQVQQKGLTFTLPSLCSKRAGCDPAKYFLRNLLGPKAKLTYKWMMEGTMIFRPEVRDALVKAGEIAKVQGYFLAIGDGTRTTQSQAENWCQRIKDTGSPKGMATPGYSNHQTGTAVDIALVKLFDNGFYRQVTVLGGICDQVTNQTVWGPEYLKILDGIMAAAGFKHMCQEVWHFDYRGIYPIDCNECEFPGSMQARVDKDKTCKK